MDTIWIIVIAALAIVAISGTISAILGQRAPRVAPDPERLARLRDRISADLARHGREQVEERIAEEHDARTDTPQRRSPISTERLWAGGL
ncbi:MAG: hypothetical protein ACQEWM_03270 [Actinomycetota bacterium]